MINNFFTYRKLQKRLRKSFLLLSNRPEYIRICWLCLPNILKFFFTDLVRSKKNPTILVKLKIQGFLDSYLCLYMYYWSQKFIIWIDSGLVALASNQLYFCGICCVFFGRFGLGSYNYFVSSTQILHKTNIEFPHYTKTITKYFKLGWWPM